MTKKDLQKGMVLETRDGVKMLYYGKSTLYTSEGWFEDLEDYGEDLINTSVPHIIEFDIVAVYKTKYTSLLLPQTFDDLNLELMWERDSQRKKTYTIEEEDESGFDFSFDISPLYLDGYGRGEDNIEIVLNGEKYDGANGTIFLSVKSAKETIKVLTEIVNYIEGLCHN